RRPPWGRGLSRRSPGRPAGTLIHVFPFSPRPGTPAASMPGRPAGRVVAARVDELLALAQQKAEAFAKSQIGCTLPLLVEEGSPPSGWSDNYLHITLPEACECSRNTLVTARILSAIGGRELQGEPVFPSGRR
ncbi:MAG: hypothetical protein IJJ33_02365, partial [Victivallales bacterium]|nr:hypothetical protein [Victivallales bacterium]